VAKELGADGVVIGCLTAEGRVDRERCERLMEMAAPLDITFHRAFDMTRDRAEALEDLATLGIRRVLTSGGHTDVPTGLAEIHALVEQAAGRLSVMPGGGVTEGNVADIVRATGVREIHLSARHEVRSRMQFRNQGCGMGAYTKDDEYVWKEASVEKIRQAKAALTEALAARRA
jgi:copper homeostasis protein